jgi:hypothetical protein
MAFVNELIPEGQKDKFPFAVYTAHDGSKPTLYKWTIDQERKSYLVKVREEGGGYVLSWKGELVHFQCDPYSSGSKASGRELSLRVYHLTLPTALQDQEEEVQQLIREALDARGWLYDRHSYATVNIKFELSP